MTLVVWQPSKTIVRRRTQLNILLSDGQVIIKVLWWECRMDTGHSWTQKTPAQEKEMATHCSILAWKNPWTEEPGRLKSMGLHDWACVHKGEGRWVGSNKPVELKKKNKKHQLRVEPPRGCRLRSRWGFSTPFLTQSKGKKKIVTKGQILDDSTQIRSQEESNSQRPRIQRCLSGVEGREGEWGVSV